MLSFWVVVVKIDFFEIPAEGLSLTVEDTHWFPDDLLLQQFQEAVLFLKRYEQRVLVKGRLSLVVSRECDRCLDTFDMAVKSDFEVDLELAVDSEEMAVEADHHCHENEMDRVVLSEPVIDVYHILQQQVYLALPIKSLCSKKCQGVCMICGENLNHKKCRCTPDIDSPFSALAALTSKEKE